MRRKKKKYQKLRQRNRKRTSFKPRIKKQDKKGLRNAMYLCNSYWRDIFVFKVKTG